MRFGRRTPELLSQQRRELEHTPRARRDWRRALSDPRLLIAVAAVVWALVFHGSLNAETRLVALAVLVPAVYAWHRFRRARAGPGGVGPDELREMGVPEEVVGQFRHDGFREPGEVRGFTFSRVKHADGHVETHFSRMPHDGEFTEPPGPPPA